MSSRIQFEKEATCIVLIAGRKLRSPDGQVIERIVKTIIDNKSETKGYFHGNACGKYDHVIEFKNPSAKVARYVVSKIRRRILKELPRSRKLSTSVILGSQLKLVGHSAFFEEDYEKPIRTYSLIRAHGNRIPELTELAGKFNSSSDSKGTRMKLIWTDSVFSVLITSAYDIKNALTKVKSFIVKAKKIESSTIAALRYGQNDPEKRLDMAGPHAVIFAKLQTLRPLRINRPIDFLRFSKEVGRQPTRLGDYDKCLLTTKTNLADIMEVTRKLKKDNPRNLLHTVTILMLGDEEDAKKSQI